MKFNKVVLAYSGGLDTSVIAKWLMEKYNCEVITFTADIGQGAETKDAKAKAKKLGIKRIYIENLIKDYQARIQHSGIRQYHRRHFC